MQGRNVQGEQLSVFPFAVPNQLCLNPDDSITQKHPVS